MVKIFAPNKQFTGVSASVSFVNGVGECSNPYLLEWFQRHGYGLEHESQNDEHNERKSMDKMSVPELKEYAKEMEIDLGQATKKDEIIALIQAKGGAENGK